MQSTQQWGRREGRSVPQTVCAAGSVCSRQAVCASMRSARSACLLVARTARCFYHEGLPLAPSSCPSSPSRSQLRSRPCSQRAQRMSHRRLQAEAPAKLRRKAPPTSAAHRLQRPQQRPQQRQQHKCCRVRSTLPTSNSKGKGKGKGRAVQCSRPVHEEQSAGSACGARFAVHERPQQQQRQKQQHRPSGSGEGGGGLFVARMGRLFFAPSKKFLNFSSASPAHCSPYSRTLQPATAPAAAPTAAGHTGGIGHRGMA